MRKVKNSDCFLWPTSFPAEAAAAHRPATRTQKYIFKILALAKTLMIFFARSGSNATVANFYKGIWLPKFLLARPGKILRG